MLSRLCRIALALAALTYVPAASAQGTAPSPKSEAGLLKENLSLKEQILTRQYQEFEQQLLRLKQRMERSPKQEDRDRALVLDRVLEYCKERSLSVQFEQMVELLKSKELRSLPDIKQALERSSQIAEDLNQVITMLREDTRAKILRDERMRLEALLKELEAVIRDQKAVEGLTQNNRTEKKELKGLQDRVTDKTAELGKKLDGKGGDAKSAKGTPKPGGKNSGQAAKSKGDGEKSDQAKEPKGGGMREKPPEQAKTPPTEPKETPPAQAKSGKPGEPGEPGPKAQAKAGESSSGQSKSKAGSPKEGSPSEQQAKAGEPGKKPNSPPGEPKENPPTGKKQVESAEYKMKQASAKIDQEKNEPAADLQNDALRDLEKAKKDLEKLLRQLREEELEKLLGALQARCEKMLAMQQQVLSGTVQLDKAIAANDDKQPNRENKIESLKLSDKEGDIVLEASKAIEMLEAEGSAVAFPEVFHQVREDMKHVQRRLGVTDTAVVTQAIERDIIDSLKEMIEALKKQRQELGKGESKGESGPPPPPQLLDKIAELKMIRSLQIRVNTRTVTYGKMYQGEQAGEVNIRRELHNLSERQERIFEVTNRMAKGDNR